MGMGLKDGLGNWFGVWFTKPEPNSTMFMISKPDYLSGRIKLGLILINQNLLMNHEVFLVHVQ